MWNERIYLAGSYGRREELCEYAAERRSMGYIVSCRCLTDDHSIEDDQLTKGELLMRTVSRFAEEDLQDLLRADCIISFTEMPKETVSRGGRHVELGFALAQDDKMRLIIVGPRENVFHYLPVIEHYDTWEAARTQLLDEAGFRAGWKSTVRECFIMGRQKRAAEEELERIAHDTY